MEIDLNSNKIRRSDIGEIVRKPQKDKHNILADLVQTDGSIDGEKLMEKLEKNQVQVANGVVMSDRPQRPTMPASTPLSVAKQNSVEHPSHYNQGIECIKYINSHNLNFNAGNIIKYGTRYLLKGKPIEDLQKVIQYAQFEIERLKAEGKK